MFYPQSRFLYLIAILSDVALLLGALLFGGLWEGEAGSQVWVPAAVLLVVWFVVSLRTSLYSLPPAVRFRAELRILEETWLASLAIASVTCIIANGALGFEAWNTLAFGAVALGGARLLWRGLDRVLPEHHDRWNRVLLVGRGGGFRKLVSSSRIGDPSCLVGYVPFPGEQDEGDPSLKKLGNYRDLPAVIAEHHVASLIVCPSEQALTRDVEHVIGLCDEAGMPLYFLPAFLSTLHLQGSLETTGGFPALTFSSNPQVSLAGAIKRAVDITVGFAGLVLAMPVMTVCALAIWLEGRRGNVLYMQTRVGRNGRSFQCYKFRTMRPDADLMKNSFIHANEQDGPAFKMRNDPRVTAVGRILRRYSLDELPQFWNVLMGDMSLVGPRPPIPSEVQEYAWWQRRRISVRPGMTGIWQVWGRNKVSFTRWIEMDLYYIDNWSLWLDVKLLLRTLGTVLRGSGV